MKCLKVFIIGIIFAILAASFVEAKSFSSSSRSSFSSSSSRSFSSSSSKPSTSSKSFSSSSTKPSSSSGSIFKSSVPPKSAPYVSSGTTKIDSSKVKFSDTSTRKTLGTYTIKPRTNYVPSTYGSYSRNYYGNSGGFNTNWLMYYMIVDSMSDAAVMTAMTNRDGYDEWKNNAVASNDPALIAKINDLEARMASLNATNSTNSTYMDPVIEAQLKQAVEGGEIEDGETDIAEIFLWVGGAALALVLIFVGLILIS